MRCNMLILFEEEYVWVNDGFFRDMLDWERCETRLLLVSTIVCHIWWSNDVKSSRKCTRGNISRKSYTCFLANCWTMMMMWTFLSKLLLFIYRLWQGVNLNHHVQFNIVTSLLLSVAFVTIWWAGKGSLFVYTLTMSYSSLGTQVMAHVIEGSHSFTCHPLVYPQVEWTIPAFNRPPQSVATLWLVVISSPAEGRRMSDLSWPGWLGEIQRMVD